MVKVSKCLLSFENISGNNEVIIKSILFDFENCGVQRPHVPTHVRKLHVPNRGLTQQRLFGGHHLDFLVNVLSYIPMDELFS